MHALSVAARSLRFPWPSSSAPHGASLSKEALAFAEQFALLQNERARKKFLAVDVGSLTALTYPGAPLHVQRLLAEFFGWVFLQDDFFDEADVHDPTRLSSMLSAFIAVLDGLDVPGDAPPPVVALADLRKRLVGLSTRWWWERFASSMRRYWLGGVLEEARHRQAGIVPDITRYLDVRMESVCVYPVLDLLEAAYGFTLAPDRIDDPVVIETRRAATLAIALSNDVFSYEKEVKAGDPHNFVHLLMVHEKRSLEAALAYAVETHNDLVARFDEFAAELDAQGPAMRVYVEGHRRWMRGAFDWQARSLRYATTRPTPSAPAVSAVNAERSTSPDASGE